MELRLQTCASSKRIVYAVPRALVFSAMARSYLLLFPADDEWIDIYYCLRIQHEVCIAKLILLSFIDLLTRRICAKLCNYCI